MKKKLIGWLSMVIEYSKHVFEEGMDDEYGMIFNEAGYPESWSESRYRARLFLQIFDVIQFAFNYLICTFRGHDYDVESYCDGDSGSEDFTCTRCGDHHHICYY